MCSATFISFSHPRAVIDVLTDVMIGVGVGMLSDVLAVAITDVMSFIDVDMLANENINGLAVMTTPLEFTLPAPGEESIPFC